MIKRIEVKKPVKNDVKNIIEIYCFTRRPFTHEHYKQVLNRSKRNGEVLGDE